jgi:hypothetical protein
VLVTVCGTKRSLPPGRILVVVKNRPISVGEDNCIETAIKKVPIHQTILPEA